ncbi:MAG: TIGR01212 family radical SAM protein [Clostridia bacterium]|nr:TIGR01212 family radical SAM protein [Clostridia bacterium]
MNRYNHLNEFYKKKFGERVLKICIDGGFTCPNRDGTCGTGGCIFCGNSGSGEHLNSLHSISDQVKNFFHSYKASRANKFIVYFQNFSNTYDSLENLKSKYDAALIDERIIGISVATRPDCIDDAIASLLHEYSNNYYVCVELGFQTSNERTAKLINRGYENHVFVQAISILKKYNIDVITHIMIGLPGEIKEDLNQTINFLNQQDIQGIKIHSTYIIKNTKLAQMYQNKEYIPLTLREYIDLACFTISRLNPKFIIHRISGDAPKELLIAPEWNLHKKWILNGIEKELKEKDLWQGKCVEFSKTL